jgi:hypothetical protein
MTYRSLIGLSHGVLLAIIAVTAQVLIAHSARK